MPFLPLHDLNPRILLQVPWVTYGLIAACCLIYFLEMGASQQETVRLFYALGIIPDTLVGNAVLPPELYLVPPYATLFTSIFLHGSFMHLLGNMLFLWVFGDNVEDSMGHLRFIVFYLLCGLLAGLVHVASDPSSQVPTIGASGAVSGILGAYLLLHPKAKVLIPILIFPVYLPAALLLVIWFGFQAVSAWGGGAQAGGVAWWAHIGGFVAGAILIVPFRYKTIPLFGAHDLPTGVTMAPRARWQRAPRQHDSDGPPRRGPWR